MARGKVYNKIYNEEDWSKVNNENKNIMEDYLDEYRQRKKSLGTIKQYKNDLRILFIYILHQLDNKCIFELKKKDFRRYNIWLQDKGMSNARVNRLMSACRSMLTYCEDDDEYEYDNNVSLKVHGLEKKPVRTNDDNFFMTFEQVMKVREELLKRGELQLAVLHMLLFDSAGRRNEIYQVKKQGLLNGNKTNKVIGKRGKEFELVYLDDTKELIKQWLEYRGEDNIDSLWVKIKKDGTKSEISYETLYDWILKISKILSEIEGRKIDIFCHSYRHSRAEILKQGQDTRLLDKNGKPRVYSIEEIQKFLHHSSSDTSQGYLRNHDSDIIDDMFGFSNN